MSVERGGKGFVWQGGDAPEWDAELARTAVGKTIILGVTSLDAVTNAPKSHEQYHGVIVSADGRDGVCIRCGGAHEGELFWLPADPTVFTEAPLGEYRLRSTGEVIVDPDFATQWSYVPPVVQ